MPTLVHHKPQYTTQDPLHTRHRGNQRQRSTSSHAYPLGMQEYKAELSKQRESTKNPALAPEKPEKAPAVATTVEELKRKVAAMAKQLEELEGPLLSPSVPAEAEAKPKAAVHEHEVHPGEEERWNSFLESDHGTPGH